MAFISTKPLKAKYAVKSTKRDGRKMEERCDTKKQVRDFLKSIAPEQRTNIRLYTLTPLKAVEIQRDCWRRH